MKHRKDYFVNVISEVKIGDTVTIRPTGKEEANHKFILTSSKDQVIATCDSAKRLSDWSFSSHAFSVVHDFDLKLSENEP